MRRAHSAATAACLLGGLLGGLSGTVGGGIAAAGAQENPMLGSWTAVDPGTGIHDVLTITPDDLAFGSAQAAIPYRFEETGDGLAVYLGEAEDPARFIFLDDMNARLSVPGGPSIALRRNGPTPAAQTPAAQTPATGKRVAGEPEHAAADGPGLRDSVIDAAAEALLPQNGQTQNARSHGWPLEPSLEGLLTDGWQLDDVTGSTGHLTFLMSNGGHHAACVLLPRDPGGPDSAVFDCRRLN